MPEPLDRDMLREELDRAKERDREATKTADAEKAKVYVVVGALLVGAVIAYFAWPRTGPDEPDDAICILAPIGAGLIAKGMTRNGSSAAEIARLGAAAGSTFACEKAIDSMKKDPSKNVKIQTLTPQGTQSPVLTVNRQAFELPPLKATPKCADWRNATFRQWCQQGLIDPPTA